MRIGHRPAGLDQADTASTVLAQAAGDNGTGAARTNHETIEMLYQRLAPFIRI